MEQNNEEGEFIKKLDLLANRLDRLAEISERLVSKDTSTQVVHIHKTEGVTNWGTAAIVACFCTWLFIIVFSVIIVADIHDIKAWSDINKNDIATIKGKLK